MNSTLGEICRWCLVAYKRFGWRFGVPRSECVLGENLQRVSLIFRVVEDRMCGCDKRVLPNVQGGMATRVQRASVLDEVRRARAPSATCSLARGSGSLVLKTCRQHDTDEHERSCRAPTLNTCSNFQKYNHLTSITVLIRLSSLEPQRSIPSACRRSRTAH